QARHAAQIHGDMVLPANLLGTRRIGATRAEEGFRHLLEVPFKSAGGDDFEDRGHGVARVPEGVRNPPRLAHEGARASPQDLVANLDPDRAADDVGDLIFIAMRVDRRREGPWLDRMLDQRHPPTRLRASGQIPRSHSSKVDELALGWSYDEDSVHCVAAS